MASPEQKIYEFDESIENERLAGQHKAVKLAMGKLVLAPLDVTRKGLRILDLATSDGYWLEDFSASLLHPETCELVGTDFTSERFPKEHRGISLVVQDSLQPFPASWAQSFDLVHQRFVLLGIPDPRRCVSALLGLVRPGGWVQLVELEDNADEPNGPQMKRLIDFYRDFGLNIGSNFSFQNGGLESWLKKAGFIRVGTMVAPVCLGAQCPAPDLREQTVNAYTVTATQFLASYNRRHGAFNEADKIEPDKYLPALASELRQRGGYQRLRVAWAQRPF